MTVVRFSTPTGLPRTPSPDMQIVRVTFRTCPGSDLRLDKVLYDPKAPRDEHGMQAESWWAVTCKGRPTRCLQLYQGAHSLSQLLMRYGFQDATGCVNHKDATAYFESQPMVRDGATIVDRVVTPELRSARGVPQFYPNSGICWYAAMCMATFGHPVIRRVVLPALPDEIRSHAAKCLESRDSALELRKYLWNNYQVGDDISKDPRFDGRNGFSEFCVLFAKLGIPQIVYREERNKLVPAPLTLRDRANRSVKMLTPCDPTKDFHLLTLRFQDGDHQGKFPVVRRLNLEVKKGVTVKYRVAALIMGQRVCGHQISTVCTSEKGWRRWIIADADMHKSGIGPTHIYFDGDDYTGCQWWAAWRDLVHVTRFGNGGSELCVISPHNPKDGTYDKYRGEEPGSNSIDMIFVPCRDC